MSNTRPGIQWIWTGASAIATAIGASIAIRYFPEAGFAENPTGEYGPHLIGFAIWVGLSLAIVQCLVLATLLQTYTATRFFLLITWVPITTAGIVAMMMPLWWRSAMLFSVAPWMVIFPLLPGTVLLGLGQWLILFLLFKARFVWVTLTVLGVVIGAVAGLIVAVYLVPIQLEITWAAITGAGIGTMQGYVLAQILASDNVQDDPQARRD